MVNFCTRKLNRLRMKVKILVNSSIRKVDGITFKVDFVVSLDRIGYSVQLEVNAKGSVKGQTLVCFWRKRKITTQHYRPQPRRVISHIFTS